MEQVLPTSIVFIHSKPTIPFTGSLTYLLIDLIDYVSLNKFSGLIQN